MRISIESIPHSQQRYPTVGDWYWNDDHSILFIKVSDLKNWDYNFLVAFHELIEAVLCKHAGITQEQIDKFDMEFMEKHPDGEPGLDNSAPYRRQHLSASQYEKELSYWLDVNWKDYEEAVNELFEEKSD